VAGDVHASGCGYLVKSNPPGEELGTVRTYIQRIYEKLHVHSHAEAVMKLRAGSPHPAAMSTLYPTCSMDTEMTFWHRKPPFMGPEGILRS
jgi:hypothetical protein